MVWLIFAGIFAFLNSSIIAYFWLLKIQDIEAELLKEKKIEMLRDAT